MDQGACGYGCPRYFFSCNSIKNLAHKFVESTRRVDSLFGSLFELRNIELEKYSTFVIEGFVSVAQSTSEILKHGLLVQETQYLSCA
jgi:hypothetical protein